MRRTLLLGTFALLGLANFGASASGKAPETSAQVPTLAQASLAPYGPAQGTAAPGVSQAPNQVRPYATVDVFQDVADRADGRWVSQLRSGGMSPSYVGIDERHAFADSLVIRAQVEQGIDVVDARIPDHRIGDRTLTLELQGSYGTLRLGRQFTPHVLFLGGEIDAFTVGFAGSPYAVWDGGVRLERRSAALLYETPASDAWSGQFMVAKDAHRNDSSARDRDGLFARLERRLSGGFVGISAISERNKDQTQTRNAIALGAGASIGSLELTAGCQVEGGRQMQRFHESMLGAIWTHDRHQWLVSWGDSRSSDGTHGGVVAGIAYVFLYSKQTNFYASAARLRNRDDSSFDLGTATNAAGKASDAMVGVRQRF